MTEPIPDQPRLRLWLDDMRSAPAGGWSPARSVDEARALIEATLASGGEFAEASLDYNLGIWVSEGGYGFQLVEWMAETNTWPTVSVAVHSDDRVGSARMRKAIDRLGPYPAQGVTPA